MRNRILSILLRLALLPTPAAAHDCDMWCLKLQANSHFVVDAHGNPVALRKNAAMIEYEKRLRRAK